MGSCILRQNSHYLQPTLRYSVVNVQIESSAFQDEIDLLEFRAKDTRYNHRNLFLLPAFASCDRELREVFLQITKVCLITLLSMEQARVNTWFHTGLHPEDQYQFTILSGES